MKATVKLTGAEVRYALAEHIRQNLKINVDGCEFTKIDGDAIVEGTEETALTILVL